MVNPRPYRVGDPVLVAWGFDEIEGVVTGYYGHGALERVRVKLGALDDDDAPEVSVPAGAVSVPA